MKGEINTRRTLPCLTGVAGSPLRILGSKFLEVSIGQVKVHKQWFPVVRDNYLSTDLLLGCDVSGQSSFLRDHSKKLMYWGNAPYVIRLVAKRKGKVETITQIPPPVMESASTHNLNTTKNVVISNYHT